MFVKNVHSFSCSITPACSSGLSTFFMCMVCDSGLNRKEAISSMWTNAKCHLTGDSITPMPCWIVSGAFCAPRETLGPFCSRYCDAKAFLTCSLSATSICHESLSACKVENINVSPKVSVYPSVLGIRTRLGHSCHLSLDNQFKILMSRLALEQTW